MADGGVGQRGFNFPHRTSASAGWPGEIVVDLFAGGGGASVALEEALQRPVDVAINHDEFAVGMHAANHPLTRHLHEDVWVADPRAIAAGRPVGWLHASPDCTHFSQARGGQPRSRKTRSLSWVVIKWAGRLRGGGHAPRYISLENVEQILTWGPLVAKRDKATGRVLKMDGTVADPGEQVAIGNQQLIPDKKRAGQTWDRFVAILRGFGYDVEWRKVVAADHGAGTSRKRLFLVARCDGQPIVWPEPTHGPGRAQPYVTAADCIDWSIPGKSIFGRKKPLADATLRRIARGIKRYVLDAAEPFIVPGTIIEHASAILAGVGGRAGDSEPRTVAAPGYTTTGKADCAVITAFVEQANGGGPNGNPAPARAATDPVSAITASGSQQRVVEAHMAPELSPEQEAGALRVAAFLINYYGNGQALDLREPVDTITTRDRLALVTVHVRVVPYVIVDITLRMLTPPELYRAQGFPANYIIDHTADGRKLTISQQVRMVGNSVSPPPLAAIIRANLDVREPMRAAA